MQIRWTLQKANGQKRTRKQEWFMMWNNKKKENFWGGPENCRVSGRNMRTHRKYLMEAAELLEKRKQSSNTREG